MFATFKPFQPVSVRPTQCSRRPRLVAATFARCQQQQGKQDAGVVERRVVLLEAAATLAAAALSRQALAADECSEFQTAPSGLQWCELVEGTGEAPMAGARIRAHYRGTLSDGAVFDSSYERGRPLVFQVGVGQVIKGWDIGFLGAEGIPPMKAGGKRMLIVPSSLAYGERGAGSVIPPGATLNFLVEYLGKQGAR